MNTGTYFQRMHRLSRYAKVEYGFLGYRITIVIEQHKTRIIEYLVLVVVLNMHNDDAIGERTVLDGHKIHRIAYGLRVGECGNEKKGKGEKVFHGWWFTRNNVCQTTEMPYTIQ